jgi:hypothetical protein
MMDLENIDYLKKIVSDILIFNYISFFFYIQSY